MLLLRRLVLIVLLAFFPTGLAAQSQPFTIVALGDSLTAGWKLPRSQAFPAQLQAALRARGHNVRVMNAGVGGDTATGGLARLGWSVPTGVDAVIVELGGNDALRGIPPAKTQAALDRIIARLKARGIKVLLAGMRSPRNLGARYSAEFDAIYPQLARKHGVPLYPFFLQGVAGDRTLNFPDGIHPRAGGVRRIVQGILPYVERLLPMQPMRPVAPVSPATPVKERQAAR